MSTLPDRRLGVLPALNQILDGILTHDLRVGNPPLPPLIAGPVQMVTTITETMASEMIASPASAVLPARSLDVSAGES